MRITSRMCDAEVNNRVLRSTINDLSEEILSQTLVRSSNTVIPKVDVSMQTEIEIHHNDNTSVGPRMEEIFETHLLKFSREMKKFNANKQVKRLKEELANSYLQLEQIKQDFEAYKIYAKELLHNEKMLNKELRQSYH
ncbi:hypothetical protein KSF78_0005200 [Schistosoma japonicum]|nr:hypothetical protein KSF78_0005200 [Schistosoma japonicum]